MELRKEIEDKETEQSFFLDVRDIFHVKYLSFRQRWPRASFLASEIGSWEAKLSVGFLDLYDTHMFVDMRSTGIFLKFYARFDFLKPIHVNKFGISPELQALWSNRVGATSGDSFGHQIVRVGAHLEQLIDMAVSARDKPRSQRQEIRDAIETIEKRRKARSKGNSKEAGAETFHEETVLPSALSDITKTLPLDEVEVSHEDVHGQVHEALDWHDQMHSSNMEMIREALDALITVIHKSDERHEQYFRKQEVFSSLPALRQRAATNQFFCCASSRTFHRARTDIYRTLRSCPCYLLWTHSASMHGCMCSTRCMAAQIDPSGNFE